MSASKKDRNIKNFEEFENLTREEIEELDKIELPNRNPKRIPYKKAFGKKCLAYLV